MDDKLGVAISAAGQSRHSAIAKPRSLSCSEIFDRIEVNSAGDIVTNDLCGDPSIHRRQTAAPK
jgi:hypothetical protein